jgi:hypothetical protein
LLLEFFEDERIDRSSTPRNAFKRRWGNTRQWFQRPMIALRFRRSEGCNHLQKQKDVSAACVHSYGADASMARGLNSGNSSFGFIWKSGNQVC